MATDFSFWSGKQGAHSEAPPDPVQEDPGSIWNLTLDNAHESEAVGPDSWRSIGKGTDTQSMNTQSVFENSSGKEQPHSGEFSGCTFDSSPQFNRMNQISNTPSSAGDQSRAVDLRPEVFKESYPSIFKMVEVLESTRASKPRDLEVQICISDSISVVSDSVGYSCNYCHEPANSSYEIEFYAVRFPHFFL